MAPIITFEPTTIIPVGLSYSALTFSSEVIMPGLDSAVMVGGENQLAFRIAIANSMEGVRTIDVMIESVLSVNIRRGLSERDSIVRSDNRSEMLDIDHSSRSLVAGTSVTWNVSAPLNRLGTSGTDAYKTLNTGLTNAMGPTGSFLTSIKELSPSFNSVSAIFITVKAFSVITVSQPTAAPTSSPTITAVIPSITLNVTAFRTNVTLSILLTKSRIVDTDISGEKLSYRRLERSILF
jgi:hypothetical protein